MWSGRKRLTRTDLVNRGLNPDELPQDLVNLGTKLLVPRQEILALNRIDQKARLLLHQWSVPFGISGSHFVPKVKLADVEQQLNGLKKEFFDTVDSFISRFEKLKEIIKQNHEDFWEKCLKPYYPTNAESLRSKYKFRWYIFTITSPGELLETNSEKLEELKQQMQAEVTSFVSEYIEAMRQETIKFCDLLRARVEGKPFGDENESKKFTGKTLTAFAKYVDKFKTMNIFGDAEISKMLDEFKTNFIVSKTPEDLTNTHVQSSVVTALVAIREKASQESNVLTRKITID